MTNDYEYSTKNILDHNFSFSKMTEKEIAQREKEFAEFQAEKLITKPRSESLRWEKEEEKKTVAKSVFKPRPIPKRK